MNHSMSKAGIASAAHETESKLSNLERILLLLPTAGGLIFGLGPLIFGGAFGAAFGLPGNDSFLYRLGGAATLGYAVALMMGLRQGEWAPLRLVIAATLTFNLASMYACVTQLMAGDTNILVSLILGTSIAITGICLWLLGPHMLRIKTEPDVSAGYIRFITVGAVLSTVFGLGPLLFPVQPTQLLGFHATDVFLIRQAGAASLGYAVLAWLGIRSGAWLEIRLALRMALIFNGFSFVASVIAWFSSEPVWITTVIGAASLFVTIVGSIASQRRGKL